MTKLSLIERERKRINLYNKYILKINHYRKILNGNYNLEEKNIAMKSLLKIPRNAHPTRLRNRCYITGRSRGYYRRFGLSRHVIRDLYTKGYIPGVTKSS